MRNDPYDGEPGAIVRRIQLDALAQDFLARPVARGQFLVDDAYIQRRAVVGAVEQAARGQVQPEHLEVVFGHYRERQRERTLFRRALLRFDRSGHLDWSGGYARGKGHFSARYLTLDRPRQFVPITPALGRLGVAGIEDGGIRRNDDLSRVQSRRLAHLLLDRQHQIRTDHQHQAGDHHLHADEQTYALVAAPAGRSFAAARQHFGRVLFGNTPCRNERTDQPDYRGANHRSHQIDGPQLQQIGIASACLDLRPEFGEALSPPDAQPRQSIPDHEPQQNDQRGLQQTLPHQTRARRTE